VDCAPEDATVLSFEESGMLLGLKLEVGQNSVKFFRKSNLVLTYWPRLNRYVVGNEAGSCSGEDDALELAYDHATWSELGL
jgi:hypothetical protein